MRQRSVWACVGTLGTGLLNEPIHLLNNLTILLGERSEENCGFCPSTYLLIPLFGASPLHNTDLVHWQHLTAEGVFYKYLGSYVFSPPADERFLMIRSAWFPVVVSLVTNPSANPSPQLLEQASSSARIVKSIVATPSGDATWASGILCPLTRSSLNQALHPENKWGSYVPLTLRPPGLAKSCMSLWSPSHPYPPCLLTFHRNCCLSS